MNILLIEDEERVAGFVRRGLAGEGWSVDHAMDGETGLELLAGNHYDVVLLDLMLPGMQGLDVCRLMRARSDTTPILMLTALDGIDERVGGLKAGADDYLPKPFDFDELVARIEALSRRANGYAIDTREDRIELGSIVFDKVALSVSLDGREINFSAKERDLLLLFMSNSGRVLARERILNAVWGLSADPLTNVVDVYVGRLRRKLGEEGERIVTIRHVGYRMD
ncbi:response regulator transcription factor [Celeribacter persicus]|jgi:Response regulators consisting of a CheY-like receiver domain and a winged-helix DNA-binding domain|uniref:DNA-binding response OmpR family regulator n=1 Tax=Celeribacter persicus TaxID=1651082 RepID=A0A2T5HSP2_9RHOB|nr:response regulator transcription factor [Celeribacter persicus]PTQ74592.1 DNA-binding response OmpR family regulator [Celeribacter persicus]